MSKNLRNNFGKIKFEIFREIKLYLLKYKVLKCKVYVSKNFFVEKSLKKNLNY